MKRITKKTKKKEKLNKKTEENNDYKNLIFDYDNEDNEKEKNKSKKITRQQKKINKNIIKVTNKNKNQKKDKADKKKQNKEKYKQKLAKRENQNDLQSESIITDENSNDYNIKIKRKVNKKRVLFLVAMVVAICCYLSISVYNLIKNPTDSVLVSEGSISQEETVDGYIIRDETVIKGENYKNGMVEIKSEGEKVASGDPIFRYYSAGEDDLKKKIADLDVKIQEAMEENNENLFSTDTRLLDSQIEQTLDKVINTNDIQKIREYKKSITENITKKAKIAGELSPTGSYLKKLIDERSGYENELNSGAEYINATKSGIVSYRIDGLEEVLNTNDFSKINKEFLQNLNLKTGQIISASNEGGKIVNNFICYIACTSKSKEANEAEIGDKVRIALPSQREVEAKVEYIIREDDDEVTIVFSFSEGIEELLSYRKVSVDIIWWSAEGFKVPNSSIFEKDGLNYVIRTKSGYLDRVLIKVQKTTDNYSIVTNYSTSEKEELDIGKNVSTSIILYDELLLNPTEEQINHTT